MALTQEKFEEIIKDLIHGRMYSFSFDSRDILSAEQISIIFKALLHPDCEATYITIDPTLLGEEDSKIEKHLFDGLRDPNCKVKSISVFDRYSLKIKYEGLKCFVDVLRDPNCKVTRINLGINQITDEGAKYLADVLRDPNCKVTDIDLNDNQITDEGAKYLAGALRDPNCKVTRIDLGRNQITDEGAKYLADALRDPNCKVTDIVLGHNQITDEGGGYFVSALQHDSCKVTFLTFGYKEISETILGQIEVSLNKNKLRALIESVTSVGNDKTEIRADNKQITCEEVKFLADALLDPNCKVTRVSFYNNQIVDEGVKYLADALRDPNCKVTRINLGSNQITDEGAKYLADALRDRNCKVTNIDLGGNQITDEGVKYLADALGDPNCKVTKINLSHNNITNRGAEYFSNVLENNRTLTDIYFGENQVSEEFESRIKALVARNRKIKDDFLDLIEKAIAYGQLKDLKSEMNKSVIPLAHQSYALKQVIEAAADVNGSWFSFYSITRLLGMIGFLSSDVAVVDRKVLNAIERVDHPEIADLVRKSLYDPQSNQDFEELLRGNRKYLKLLHSAIENDDVEEVRNILAVVDKDFVGTVFCDFRDEIDEIMIADLLKDAKTALHMAVRKSNPEMVELLLKHGARMDVVDRKGKTPLDLAKSLSGLTKGRRKAKIIDLISSYRAFNEFFDEDKYLSMESRISADVRGEIIGIIKTSKNVTEAIRKLSEVGVVSKSKITGQPEKLYTEELMALANDDFLSVAKAKFNAEEFSVALAISFLSHYFDNNPDLYLITENAQRVAIVDALRGADSELNAILALAALDPSLTQSQILALSDNRFLSMVYYINEGEDLNGLRGNNYIDKKADDEVADRAFTQISFLESLSYAIIAGEESVKQFSHIDMIPYMEEESSRAYTLGGYAKYGKRFHIYFTSDIDEIEIDNFFENLPSVKAAAKSRRSSVSSLLPRNPVRVLGGFGSAFRRRASQTSAPTISEDIASSVSSPSAEELQELYDRLKDFNPNSIPTWVRGLKLSEEQASRLEKVLSEEEIDKAEIASENFQGLCEEFRHSNQVFQENLREFERLKYEAKSISSGAAGGEIDPRFIISKEDKQDIELLAKKGSPFVEYSEVIKEIFSTAFHIGPIIRSGKFANRSGKVQGYVKVASIISNALPLAAVAFNAAETGTGYLGRQQRLNRYNRLGEIISGSDSVAFYQFSERLARNMALSEDEALISTDDAMKLRTKKALEYILSGGLEKDLGDVSARNHDVVIGKIVAAIAKKEEKDLEFAEEAEVEEIEEVFKPVEESKASERKQAAEPDQEERDYDEPFYQESNREMDAFLIEEPQSDRELLMRLLANQARQDEEIRRLKENDLRNTEEIIALKKENRDLKRLQQTVQSSTSLGGSVSQSDRPGVLLQHVTSAEHPASGQQVRDRDFERRFAEQEGRQDLHAETLAKHGEKIRALEHQRRQDKEGKGGCSIS